MGVLIVACTILDEQTWGNGGVVDWGSMSWVSKREPVIKTIGFRGGQEKLPEGNSPLVPPRCLQVQLWRDSGTWAAGVSLLQGLCVPWSPATGQEKYCWHQAGSLLWQSDTGAFIAGGKHYCTGAEPSGSPPPHILLLLFSTLHLYWTITATYSMVLLHTMYTYRRLCAQIYLLQKLYRYREMHTFVQKYTQILIWYNLCICIYINLKVHTTYSIYNCSPKSIYDCPLLDTLHCLGEPIWPIKHPDGKQQQTQHHQSTDSHPAHSAFPRPPHAQENSQLHLNPHISSRGRIYPILIYPILIYYQLWGLVSSSHSWAEGGPN